ncbi:MAG: SHOCT domain-containing protein [Armatimonadota bacterium]|nr:SHOCT domain-containing protein [Armatimonadota bacterium]MDR7421159.1 SHOCT domain-containing protein [Armatimonadota bacterium]MDR7453475.1 SHOCT domain-containing protein [Armatimonadota bacterium]MDR7457256.1 SHOCT domain-containing protein [Armatimonadota bacterium]MDR7496095.1 SHOCT domain-containing protein [Armatimonadota bacterium]
MSGRDVAIVALVVVGALILIPLLGGGMMGGWGMGPGMMGPGMMGGQWYGRGGGPFLLSGIFWLAILAGVVLLIVSLVRQAPPRAGGEEAPLEILKRRLARGEISREEYDALKRELS